MSVSATTPWPANEASPWISTGSATAESVTPRRFERSVCSARVRPSTTGSTASRWLGFARERDGDVAVRGRARRLGAEVVLHVAGAALGVGRDRLDRPLALELAQDHLVGPPDDVREHAQPAAVRHPHHDLVRAGLGGELDRVVEHRHHRVEPLDRELLLAEERAAQVALEAADAHQAREQLAALLGRERRAEAAGLDRAPQPDALLVVGDVLDLVRDRAAVGLAELRQDVCERLAREVDAEVAGRDPRLQLGRQLRLETARLERRVADGVDPSGSSRAARWPCVR